jgi:hypothetical protein
VTTGDSSKKRIEHSKAVLDPFVWIPKDSIGFGMNKTNFISENKGYRLFEENVYYTEISDNNTIIHDYIFFTLSDQLCSRLSIIYPKDGKILKTYYSIKQHFDSKTSRCYNFGNGDDEKN